jgi:hypothetical protein
MRLLKKNRFLFLLLGICVLLTACGLSQQQPEPVPAPGTEIEEPVVEKESVNVTLYYVDVDLMGLQEETHTIEYLEKSDLYHQIWERLSEPTDAKHLSLWTSFSVHHIGLVDELLVVDLSPPSESQMGSSAEGLAIQALLQSFGQLEGVMHIQLLINGEKEETLAGHVTILEPFSKDELIYDGN